MDFGDGSSECLHLPSKTRFCCPGLRQFAGNPRGVRALRYTLQVVDCGRGAVERGDKSRGF